MAKPMPIRITAAKESVATGKTVRELCLEQLDTLGIDEGQLAAALDPASMTAPKA